MKMETKKFRLTGKMPILGSIAGDKEIFTNYIASKALEKKGDPHADENYKNALKDVENVPDADETEKQRPTVFYREVGTGAPILKAYQVKGFFKEAAGALKSQLGLTAHVKGIDNYVFFEENDIKIMRGGEQIMEPDDYLERPLRGETAQGPRVALAKSEQIHPEWYIDITVKVLTNEKTSSKAKGKPITMDVIEELLAYGELKGLVQWRNAGYGSFTFEVLED